MAKASYLDSLRLELQESLVEGVKTGKIKVDMAGHCRNGSILHKNYFASELSMLWLFKEGDLQSLLNAIKETKKTENWIDLPMYSFECYDCGERLKFKTNGKEIKCKSKCAYPKGYPAIEFDLNVPSGKMVVANDLRKGFRIVGGFNVNMMIGTAKTSHAYAEVGMAHCFVGNTCPGMYKVPNKNEFVIGRASTVKGSKCVAGICTDLWWYSIVDADEFEKAYGMKPTKDSNLDIVKCEPGVYHFKHVYHLVDYEDNSAVYTYIHRKGKPQKPKDFKSEYMKLNYTVGQIMADAVHKYPSRYGDGKSVESVQRLADHVLCTSGNGYEPHPNGWLGASPEIDTSLPEVKIPEFEGKYRWYPLSEFSWLYCASIAQPDSGRYEQFKQPIHLNDSFLDLAFKICRSILKYGLEPFQGHKDKTEIAFARKCFKGLAKKYPDKVPENCKEFLK